MEIVARGWLLLEMTDSAFMVGLGWAAWMAPFFFFGILSGVVADRVIRRIFIRLTSLGSGAAVGILAVLLFTDIAEPWHVIVLAALSGTLFSFHQTTNLAYIYDIVGPRNAMNGMSLEQLGRTGGWLVGSLLSGILIVTVGIDGQYVFVAGAYVIVMLLLLPIKGVAQAAPIQREPVLQNLTGAVRLLRSSRVLLILMCLTATSEVFAFSHHAMVPVLARDEVGVGAMGLGVLTAFHQAGGILALLILAALGDFRRKGLLWLFLTISYGVAIMALFLASKNIFALALVLPFANGCSTSVDTVSRVLMQDNVPNEERGRAMGAWTVSIGAGPIGHLGIGRLAVASGAPMALLIFGSAQAFIGALASIGLPRIRRLE